MTYKPVPTCVLLGLMLITAVPFAHARPAAPPPPVHALDLPPSSTRSVPSGSSPAALRTMLLYGTPGLPTFPTAAAPRGAASDSLADRPHDPWLARDKVQHLTFSFLFTLGGQYMLVNKVSWSEGRALPLAVGLSAGIGVAKELYDWRMAPARYFSYRDLVADTLGIVLAAGFILL